MTDGQAARNDALPPCHVALNAPGAAMTPPREWTPRGVSSVLTLAGLRGSMGDMTKAEVRDWLKRIREDVRDVEAALRANDWPMVKEYAADASGAAEEIVAMFEDERR